MCVNFVTCDIVITDHSIKQRLIRLYNNLIINLKYIILYKNIYNFIKHIFKKNFFINDFLIEILQEI